MREHQESRQLRERKPWRNFLNVIQWLKCERSSKRRHEADQHRVADSTNPTGGIGCRGVFPRMADRIPPRGNAKFTPRSTAFRVCAMLCSEKCGRESLGWNKAVEVCGIVCLRGFKIGHVAARNSPGACCRRRHFLPRGQHPRHSCLLSDRCRIYKPNRPARKGWTPPPLNVYDHSHGVFICTGFTRDTEPSGILRRD